MNEPSSLLRSTSDMSAAIRVDSPTPPSSLVKKQDELVSFPTVVSAATTTGPSQAPPPLTFLPLVGFINVQKLETICGLRHSRVLVTITNLAFLALFLPLLRSTRRENSGRRLHTGRACDNEFFSSTPALKDFVVTDSIMADSGSAESRLIIDRLTNRQENKRRKSIFHQ